MYNDDHILMVENWSHKTRYDKKKHDNLNIVGVHNEDYIMTDGNLGSWPRLQEKLMKIFLALIAHTSMHIKALKQVMLHNIMYAFQSETRMDTLGLSESQVSSFTHFGMFDIWACNCSLWRYMWIAKNSLKLKKIKLQRNKILLIWEFL